jgi:hypothetical protein
VVHDCNVEGRRDHRLQALNAQAVDRGKDGAQIAEHIVAAAAAEERVRSDCTGMVQALGIGGLGEGAGVGARQVC